MPNNNQPVRPITVEAFRFVHLQRPEIYESIPYLTNFIQHPSLKDSVILGTKAKKQKTAFSPFRSLQELSSINPDLYAFMFWLKKHKGSLNKADLTEETEELKPLTKDERLAIWDNLFHQTQVNSSQALVEGLIRMLQADHFLTYYRDSLKSSKKEKKKEGFSIVKLQKAAKASVVIPNQLFEKDQKVKNDRVVSKIDSNSKKILSNKLDIDILQHQIQQNKKTIKEVKEAEVFYSKKYKEEYDQAYQVYEAKLAELMKSVKEVSNDLGTVKICGEELEPFTFLPKNTLDDAYLKTIISAESLVVFQSFKTVQHTTIADTRIAIEKSLPELYKQQLSKAKKTGKKILIHKGIRMPLRNRPLNNAYVFKAVEIDAKKKLYSIYVTQYFERIDTKLRKVEAIVETSEKLKVSNTTTKAIVESDNYVTMQLFPEGIEIANFDISYDFRGIFETENSEYSNRFEYKNLKRETVSSATSQPESAQDQKIPQPNIFGLMDVKIAVFKKVNQTLCCYTEGEVSHIENILAREYKERSTRNLIRSEITTEEETERELEKLSDTTSTDRHEMQSEISMLIQEDKSSNFSASAGAGGSYGGDAASVYFNANASFNTSSSSSSSSNFSESESYAKELTQRAMKRLVEKTSYKRTAKMIREFEENNKHGFDNREGKKHVTGVYRWVDKIYKNELVNYGKRLMYEFMLPEPARNYKYLLTQKLQESKSQFCDTIVLDEPLSPEDQLILNSDDINENNFAELAAYYGVDIEEYPILNKRIAKSFSENFYESGDDFGASKPWHGSKDFDFELPEGYECIDFRCRFVAKRHGSRNDIDAVLLVANNDIRFRSENVFSFGGNGPITMPAGSSYAMEPVEGYLPISMVITDVGRFAMTIWAYCVLKDEVLKLWKAQFYGAIHQAYKEMLGKHNDALYEQCMNKQQDELSSNDGADTPNYNINPLMARSIEKREIKRLVIELIMDNIRGTYLPIGHDYYKFEPCTNTYDIDKTGSGIFAPDRVDFKVIKFLEQAFDWEIMAYNFFPYYWADEPGWGDLLTIDTAADHIFLAFLQSGMANIVLPVKPELEKSVAFFLQTGTLWQGTGFVLDGQDDLYPAIDQNLEIEVNEHGNEIEYNAQGNSVPVVESTWETRVPSTLTIVQDYSNPLEGEGLPCFCNDGKENMIGFSKDKEKYNIMEGKDDKVG